MEQINSGGDWRLPIKETDVNRRFFIEFIDGRKTTRRKCRDCGCVIESSGNTTNMRKHIRSCKKRMVSNQGILPFKVGAPEKKGYSIIAKLVYVDNFPITKVANSAQLKTMFEKLNYDKVTYQSLNCYLEELYHRAVSKMKSILAQRSKADLMSITFDKWTAIGDNKFIGVYVYHKVTKYCLGLIHYEGVCRSSDIINHLGERLKIFGLELSDMDYMVTDCGSDVQKVAQDADIFNFPCLCHIINLIVKRLLIENFDDFADEDDFEFITDSRYRLNYSDIILKVRSTVKDILSKPTLCDRLKAAQNIQGNTPLKLVAENATRWNSLFDMLERFVSLRNSVELIVDLHDFDWAKVSELINLLKPLKECTMDLQDSKANVKTAVSILKFLRQKSLSNDLLGKAIKTVWDKWIRPNQVADALLHGDGTFYDYIRRKKMPVVEDTEHSYGADASSSYKTFKDQCQNSSEFDIIDALDGFIPVNVDAERLFSWGRLSKNYLQCQMSPDNHSRNVFLNKCQHLI